VVVHKKRRFKNEKISKSSESTIKRRWWLIGVPILIIGNSGSGKSTSLRNFEPNEVGIFNVASKPLPFKKKLKKIDGATYDNIAEGLQITALNTYIVDDANYLMTFESFDKILEKGYEKFTTNAKHFYDMIKFVISDLPGDTLVYFFMHTETDENGVTKAKTVGKMIDNQICLEGLFSIVLLASTEDGKYKFTTQTDGTTIAKSPIEMFEKEIDNDLKFVDDAIREYWELPKRKQIVAKQTTAKTKEEKENK